MDLNMYGLLPGDSREPRPRLLDALSIRMESWKSRSRSRKVSLSFQEISMFFMIPPNTNIFLLLKHRKDCRSSCSVEVLRSRALQVWLKMAPATAFHDLPMIPLERNSLSSGWVPRMVLHTKCWKADCWIRQENRQVMRTFLQRLHRERPSNR